MQRSILAPLAALATVMLAVPARAADPVPAATPAGWWQLFGDATLTRLVERALASNQAIEQVAARLDQANAAARAVRASQRPNIGGTASAAALRQSLEDPAIRPFASLPGFPRDQERYSAGLSASWEIDLFGGSAKRRSAAAQAQAAAADLAAARVAIAAETATRWLTIRELQAQRRALALIRDAFAREEAAITAAVAAGTAPAAAADRLRAGRAGQAALVADADGAIAAEIEALGVLIGDAQQARADAASHRDTPYAPAIPAIEALPITLAARPDVIAADRRLVAADATLAATRASRFPRIALGGLLATIATGPAALFTGASIAQQGSAAISLPLLDFGRIDAAIADARGNRRAALAAARAASLAAAADVASAAARLDAQRTGLAARQEAFAALATTSARTATAYQSGVVDLPAVLSDERGRLVSETGLISAQAGTLKALVSVFRSTATLSIADR